MEYIQGLDGQISVFLHSLGIGFLLGVFYDAVCAVRTVLPVPPVLPTTRAARSAAGCVRWSAKSRYCLGLHSVIMIPSRLNDEIRMMKSITERAARLERLFAAEGKAAYFLNTNIALAAAVTEKETSV